MPGHAIRGERQHGVGLHLLDDHRETRDRFVGIDLRAAAVGVVEPAVLGDAEDGEARVQLRLTDLRQLRGRPAVGIGGLAARRGHADDALPVAHRRRP